MVAKHYEWDEEKNQWLKRVRNISFQEVITAINEGGILGIEKHRDQDKYPGQKMYIIKINDYVYMVPFVEDEEKYFLKTIYPSRKMTSRYLINKRRKQ